MATSYTDINILFESIPESDVRAILAQIAPEWANKNEIPDNLAEEILLTHEEIANELKKRQKEGQSPEEAARFAGMVAVTKHEQLTETVGASRAGIQAMVAILVNHAVQQGVAMGSLVAHAEQSAFLATVNESNSSFLKAYFEHSANSLAKAIDECDVNALLENAGVSLASESLGKIATTSIKNTSEIAAKMRTLQVANYLKN